MGFDKSAGSSSKQLRILFQLITTNYINKTLVKSSTKNGQFVLGRNALLVIWSKFVVIDRGLGIYDGAVQWPK